MNLVFIVGQTAVGKTDWALNWIKQDQRAGEYRSGLMNADSIQIYRELNKGSAKPDFSKYPDIPFYLFNELSVPEVCTAGFYREKALKLLNEKLPKEKVYIVGGSGFYIQALEKGMYENNNHQKGSEDSRQTQLREGEDIKQGMGFQKTGFLEAEHNQANKHKNEKGTDSSAKDGHKSKNRSESHHKNDGDRYEKNSYEKSHCKNSTYENSNYEKLRFKDPETAKLISPKDNYRILRALEVIDKMKKPLSQIKKEFQQQKLPWSYLKVGLFLEKEELLKRVKNRTEKMLKQGWIEETETLVKRGFKNWRALNSIGYKQIGLYLEGKLNKENLTFAINSATMKLAKKQKTWFKKDKNIRWFDAKLSPQKIHQELFKT